MVCVLLSRLHDYLRLSPIFLFLLCGIIMKSWCVHQYHGRHDHHRHVVHTHASVFSLSQTDCPKNACASSSSSALCSCSCTCLFIVVGAFSTFMRTSRYRLRRALHVNNGGNCSPSTSLQIPTTIGAVSSRVSCTFQISTCVPFHVEVLVPLIKSSTRHFPYLCVITRLFPF